MRDIKINKFYQLKLNYETLEQPSSRNFFVQLETRVVLCDILQQLEEHIIRAMPKYSQIPQTQPSPQTLPQNPTKIQAKFDNRNHILTLNNIPIDYPKQTLTLKGLQITHPPFPIPTPTPLLLDPKSSIQFDTKLNQNIYCIELAKTFDRGSNAVLHSLRRKGRDGKDGRDGRGDEGGLGFDANLFVFQNCQYLVRKIPCKVKCFQVVFVNLGLFKIMVLMENDRFFMELTKYIFKLVFKVDLNQITRNNYPQPIPNQNSQKPLPNLPNLPTHPQKPQPFSKPTPSFPFPSSSSSSSTNNHHLQKILQLYTQIQKALSKHKYSYERINLLLGIFTRQNRLYCFLREINQGIVGVVLKGYRWGIFGELDGDKDREKERQRQREKDRVGNWKEDGKLGGYYQMTLHKVVTLIKTVYSSLGKSQSCFETLKSTLFTTPKFPTWLSQTLQKIQAHTYTHTHNPTCTKLTQLLFLLSQIHPQFLHTFFQTNQPLLTTHFQQQIQWAYQILNFGCLGQGREEEKDGMREEAGVVLDWVGGICRKVVGMGGVGGIGGSVGLGRVICRGFCEVVGKLRACDVELLTYVCCVNAYCRKPVVKYLFTYFRKFLQQLKPTPNTSPQSSIKSCRKHKHNLLQIIQSIHKISLITEITLMIDQGLLEDIGLILQISKCTPRNFYEIYGGDGEDQRRARVRARARGRGRGREEDRENDRGDCLGSAYQAMMKSVGLGNQGEEGEEGEL